MLLVSLALGILALLENCFFPSIKHCFPKKIKSFGRKSSSQNENEYRLQEFGRVSAWNFRILLLQKNRREGSELQLSRFFPQ